MITARADTLVYLMPPGESLGAWSRTGSLSREVAFISAMLDHYKLITLVSFGTARERALLAEHLPAPLASRVSLVCNDEELGEDLFVARLPAMVRMSLADARTTLVRTCQLECGPTAVRLCHGLVQLGLQVALLGRGEYLWTRLLANQLGSESSTTVDAGRSEGALCWAADLVVGSSDAMIRDLAWRYGLHASRTRVVPPLVVAPQIDLSITRTPGLILSMGPLESRHRVETTIRAVALAREATPEAHLEVWGDGHQLDSLQALASEIGIPTRFVPHFSDQQLIDRLTAAQAFVHASDAEDHLSGVLEAMACAVPVIAADTLHVARFVQHGVTGLRVEGSPESFSVALQGMLADADWREMLGTNAARIVQEQNGLARVVQVEYEAHMAACGFAFGSPQTKSQAA